MYIIACIHNNFSIIESITLTDYTLCKTVYICEHVPVADPGGCERLPSRVLSKSVQM